MQKSFVTRINAWRFERPLAIALAASAMFMVMAVPPENLSVFPALSAFPSLQIALALIGGLLFGTAGYMAMIYPWPRRIMSRAAPGEPAIPEDDHSQFAAAEVSLRLRRADRHPDAPVREPIFASRDLGSPFMEVGAFAPTSDEPVDTAKTRASIPDGDYAEIEPAAIDEAPVDEAPLAADPVPVRAEPEPEPIAIEPEPAVLEPAVLEPVVLEPVVLEPVIAEPMAVEPAVAAEMPSPIAAFAPEDEPAPTPARAQRQSIAAMMDRLSAGLERRAANGEAPAIPPRAPALRDALDELNRLAARRG